MNWIRNERFLSYNAGNVVVLAEIMADSASDLPAADAITGKLIAKGSVALDINTGDWYCMNSSGIWKKQTSSKTFGAPTADMIGIITATPPLVGNLVIQEDE